MKQISKPERHWGLVLSGGAAYGLANIGVLSALTRWELRPHCIAGSSMGAIVAGLYALGVEPEQLQCIAGDIHLGSAVSLSKRPLQDGLHGGMLQAKLRKLLTSVVGAATIGDCKIPFVCIAGRVKRPIAWSRILREGFCGHVLENIEPYIFPPETPLLDAITASSAIPVIFSPVTVGKDTFIDLCHFGAIPARSLRQQCHPDCIIATDTSPSYPRLERWLPGPWRQFLMEGYRELEKSRKECDILLQPKLPLTPLHFHSAKTFIAEGEAETRRQEQAIRTALAGKLKRLP